MDIQVYIVSNLSLESKLHKLKERSIIGTAGSNLHKNCEQLNIKTYVKVSHCSNSNAIQ